MAEVVNLRRVRKAKTRAEDAVRAEANRMAYGRSKAERSSAKAAAERLAKRLDGAKLE